MSVKKYSYFSGVSISDDLIGTLHTVKGDLRHEAPYKPCSYWHHILTLGKIVVTRYYLKAHENVKIKYGKSMICILYSWRTLVLVVWKFFSQH